MLDIFGNIYLAGFAMRPGKSSEMLVVKYNSAGVYQWNFTWGGSEGDSAYGIAIDLSNNIYIAGAVAGWVPGGLSDAVLVKFDASREYEWNRTFGGAMQDIFNDIKLDSAENIYLAGYG